MLGHCSLWAFESGHPTGKQCKNVLTSGNPPAESISLATLSKFQSTRGASFPSIPIVGGGYSGYACYSCAHRVKQKKKKKKDLAVSDSEELSAAQSLPEGARLMLPVQVPDIHHIDVVDAWVSLEQFVGHLQDCKRNRKV
jgi:hypothetical protein